MADEVTRPDLTATPEVLPDSFFGTDEGTIALMAAEVKTWCIEKGWWDDGRTFGDEIALIGSEGSEALEAYRVAGFDAFLSWDLVIGKQDGNDIPPVTIKGLSEDGVKALTGQAPYWGGKPEGVGSELADIFVRLLHTCALHDIDLFDEWRKKMNYNWSRAYRHGGKKL